MNTQNSSSSFDTINQYVFFLVLSFIYILFNGYDYMMGPQKYFALKMLSFNHPGLMATDLLMRLQDEGYFTLLAWPLSFMNQFMSVKWLFLLGHIVTTFFYLYGVFTLAKTLFKKSLFALFCVFAVFIIKPVLIDASLYPTFFYHRNVAFALQLFSIHYMLTERYRFSALLLGISFNVTPYSAVHLSFIYAWILLFRVKVLPLGKILQAALIFIVTVCPMLIWKFSYSGDVPLGPAPLEWLEYVRMGAAYYALPLALFGPDHGGLHVMAIAAGWFVFFLMPFFQQGFKINSLHRMMIIFVSGILVLFLIGFIFTQWIPISVVLQLMFWRAHRFLVLIAVIYFSYYLLKRFVDEDSWRGRFYIAVWLTAFLSSKMLLTFILTFMDVLFRLPFVDKMYRKILQSSLVFLLAILCLSPVESHMHDLQVILNLNLIFVVLCLWTFLMGARFFTADSDSSDKKPLWKWVGFIALFAAILFPSYWKIDKEAFANPAKLVSKQVEWPWISRMSQEYHDLFAWVKSNTTQSDVFLLEKEPYLEQFFTFEAERATIFSTHRSISLHSLAFGREWFQRLNDFDFFKEKKFEDSRWRARELKKLHKKYGFAYAVVEVDSKAMNLPVVYENAKFKVYALGES